MQFEALEAPLMWRAWVRWLSWPWNLWILHFLSGISQLPFSAESHIAQVESFSEETSG